MIPTTINQARNFDFDDEKFKAPPSEVLPWCQMINPQWGQDGLKPYGLAITLDVACQTICRCCQIGVSLSK